MNEIKEIKELLKSYDRAMMSGEENALQLRLKIQRTSIATERYLLEIIEQQRQDLKDVEADIRLISGTQGPPCELCVYHNAGYTICCSCNAADYFRYKRWTT